jgi:hypothetical protein
LDPTKPPKQQQQQKQAKPKQNCNITPQNNQIQRGQMRKQQELMIIT